MTLIACLIAVLKVSPHQRSYVRDAITARDYEPACAKLLSQYRTLWDTIRDDVSWMGGGVFVVDCSE